MKRQFYGKLKTRQRVQLPCSVVDSTGVIHTEMETAKIVKIQDDIVYLEDFKPKVKLNRFLESDNILRRQIDTWKDNQINKLKS
jgi:hypothetical protein